MNLQPIYSPDSVATPAYHLRYTWSGWPSSSTFPSVPTDEFFQELDALWENDGMRWLEMTWPMPSARIQSATLATLNVLKNDNRLRQVPENNVPR
jgi:hypothetical protein